MDVLPQTTPRSPPTTPLPPPPSQQFLPPLPARPRSSIKPPQRRPHTYRPPLPPRNVPTISPRKRCSDDLEVQNMEYNPQEVTRMRPISERVSSAYGNAFTAALAQIPMLNIEQKTTFESPVSSPAESKKRMAPLNGIVYYRPKDQKRWRKRWACTKPGNMFNVYESDAEKRELVSIRGVDIKSVNVAGASHSGRDLFFDVVTQRNVVCFMTRESFALTYWLTGIEELRKQAQEDAKDRASLTLRKSFLLSPSFYLWIIYI